MLLADGGSATLLHEYDLEEKERAGKQARAQQAPGAANVPKITHNQSSQALASHQQQQQRQTPSQSQPPLASPYLRPQSAQESQKMHAALAHANQAYTTNHGYYAQQAQHAQHAYHATHSSHQPALQRPSGPSRTVSSQIFGMLKPAFANAHAAGTSATNSAASSRATTPVATPLPSPSLDGGFKKPGVVVAADAKGVPKQKRSYLDDDDTRVWGF